MGKRLGNNLQMQDIMKIKKIFDDKRWIIDEEEGSVFSRFCRRAAELPDDECRKLFCELSERYCKISDDEYMKLIIEVVEKVFKEYPEIGRSMKIYIYPLISPEDKKEGKIKSSSSVWYRFSDSKVRMGTILKKYKIVPQEEIKQRVIDDVNNGNASIFLVDDYVGTGDTAIKALKPFLDEGISKDKIIILTLVSQKQGLDYVRRSGYRISASIIKEKGITDYYSKNDAEYKKKIMRRIEKKLKVSKDFELGYGKSEALITMIKTPNNTFPVFWKEPSEDKVAPFARY